MYLGKTSTVKDISHESLHLWAREGMTPELQWRIEAELKPLMTGTAASETLDWYKDRVFTSRNGGEINAHEKLAELWESYLAGDRKSIPERLREFFDRLADAICVCDTAGVKRRGGRSTGSVRKDI
jgi:hypothetical protein